mmetsp:Transcript_4508/g.10614  ORF Transcript_4508/g.10614 Transcript_4508/m.10614 type:complete len:202 (+) Transcript_4508:207-812(+)
MSGSWEYPQRRRGLGGAGLVAATAPRRSPVAAAREKGPRSARACRPGCARGNRRATSRAVRLAALASCPTAARSRASPRTRSMARREACRRIREKAPREAQPPRNQPPPGATPLLSSSVSVSVPESSVAPLPLWPTAAAAPPWPPSVWTWLRQRATPPVAARAESEVAKVSARSPWAARRRLGGLYRSWSATARPDAETPM